MSEPLRILELRSVYGTGGGPEKTILRGAARSNPARFAVSVCYLRDLRDADFSIDRQARALALDYCEIPERHSLDVRIWPALRRLVRARRIDIVHAHDYKTDLLALLLARFEGIIPLATVHNWAGVSRREQFYYWCDKRLLRRFPRLIVVSNAACEVLLAAGVEPGRIQVILNGIDVEHYRRDPARRAEARAALQLGPADFVIGAIGRLEPEKRLDLLLEAVAQLRPRRPELRLVLAGDGSQRDALAALAQLRGLGAACRLLGHWSDVIGLHHALDVFVQSSATEGTSNALLEAMALETPIVATAVGGTAELIEHEVHGLLVPPGDVSTLAAALDRVLAIPEAARQRALAARQRVERDLSFETRMQKVEAIYTELAAERNHPSEKRRL
jgi:glycosyltransferase involved in cell wall biosynthesis